MQTWRVLMQRKLSANENQNARQRVEYVKAATSEKAMAVAMRMAPEFYPVEARKS